MQIARQRQLSSVSALEPRWPQWLSFGTRRGGDQAVVNLDATWQPRTERRNYDPPVHEASVSSRGGMVAAWLVHAYTASGAIVALAGLAATSAGDYRRAFLWMIVATVIDSTDGVLARRARVRERLPYFRGDRLDDIVDYLGYVVLPAYLLVRADLLPPGGAWPLAGLILLSSAYGFAHEQAKTSDGFFTGFPSYWNIVAFYLYAAAGPAGVNAALVVFLAIMVFVPIRYVYPSRTPVLQIPTIILTTAWSVLVLVLILDLPERHPGWLAVSLTYPIYYTALSLVLTWKRLEGRFSG